MFPAVLFPQYCTDVVFDQKSIIFHWALDRRSIILTVPYFNLCVHMLTISGVGVFIVS